MGYEVTGAVAPDKLIAGPEVGILTKVVTLKSGQGVLGRGSVIGLIEKVLGEKSFSGTGNGTMTGISIGKDALIGDYKVKCVSAATDSGTFSVVDPNGNRLGDAVVGTAFTSSHINFTINDGGTDFTAGATFTIPVEESEDAGKGKLCDANSVDGSQAPKYVLSENTDTTADAKATVYKTGYFNRDELVYGANGAPDGAEEELRKQGIFLADQLTY